MKNAIVSLFCFLVIQLNAQQNIPIGTWRNHYSFNSLQKIISAGDRIIAAGENGLMVYDITDNSISTITKSDGLQSTNVSAIAYRATDNVLVIGYASGNLDIMVNSKISNLDLVSNSQVIGDKDILDINFFANNAFISTAYGLLNLNLLTLEITDTYRELGVGASQIKVYSSLVLGDSIFLASSEGVIASNTNNGTNLYNFNNWRRYDINDGLPVQDYEFIINYKGDILAFSNGDGLYKYSGQIWSKSSQFDGATIFSLSATNDLIYVLDGNQIETSDLVVPAAIINSNLSVNPKDISVQQNTIWVADGENGLINISNKNEVAIVPNGPGSNECFRLFNVNQKILNLSGGFSLSGTPLNTRESVDTFVDGFWNNSTFNNLEDITASVVDPQGNQYFASFGQGILYRQSGGQETIFNSQNSTLTAANANPNTIYISDIVWVNEGLWVANYEGASGLHFYDGATWTAHTLASNRIIDIVNVGKYIWCIINPNAGGGILIFEKGSSASRYLSTTSGNGGLPSNTVNCIASDKEGTVWVGTNKGVATLPAAFDISQTLNAVIPIIDNGFLLRNEQIQSIIIDGGNRKWMGSKNGLWLFDANVQQELLYFSAENSPLPSNEIVDMKIQSTTGEIFIATTSGVVSYRSDATEVSSTNRNIKIFPNPVLSTYQGTIGISGLANEVVVKITDASGRLIWQTISAGGTATWDGNNLNGRRASTGVYFVFSATENGEETLVGKLAIIN